MKQLILKSLTILALAATPARASTSPRSAVAAPAMAQDEDTGELSIEANTQVEEPGTNTLWIGLLTGAILLIGLTQIVSHAGFRRSSVRNLFLGVKLQLPDASQEQAAWVRSLAPHSAMLVSPKFLAKG